MQVPRFADAPRRGPPPASAEEVARLMRRVGYAGGLLVAWALAGVVASLALGRVDGASLALAGALPPGLVALVAYALDRRAPSRAKSALVAAAGTVALVFALAGHVLFWPTSFDDRLLLLTVPVGVAWAAYAGALLLVPLYAGARLRALELAWRASGSRARGPRLTLEALARGDDLLGPVPWRRAWRGALARWIEGARLPGLMLHDAALSAHRPTDRLHAETTSEELASALAERGARVERDGRELVVTLADAPPLRVGRGRLLLPPGPALEVRGDVDAARRLRRLLEGEASHALVFSWSAPARRWERRLNALHRDALVATTLEERSLVMEELDRVRRALAERSLCGEEHAIVCLKEQSVRALLALRMLSEPPSPRTEARVLALHGALLPQLARVLDAGGLASVKRVAFVPHWIVPVRTPWGEQEVAVSAATGKLDASQSAPLLAAMRRRGPSLLLDVGAQAVFLPAPPPTGAILREMRAAGLRVPDDVATGRTPADVVFVPYLATGEGYVSGVTGAAAPDLGSAVPVAAAP